MNAGKRVFPTQNSSAGIWHGFSRIIDRTFVFDDDSKDFFLQVIQSYEELLGVEALTFCLMDNHFHILLRVPNRPEGFDLPLEVIVERLERAIGQKAMTFVRRDLDHWNRTGNDAAIEEWRQRQLKRMFSMSAFMGCIKQRFTRWHNARRGRRGTIWEERYGSVVVEDEERALRTMAAYIDLNPVRAGIVADPADYRWCGYAQAMAGDAKAQRSIVRVIGQMAWPRDAAADAMPWGSGPFPAPIRRRALVFYRAILGAKGGKRQREDGSVVRRGLSERARSRLTSPSERLLRVEILARRVPQFTRGMLIGSRAFVDRWFEENRDYVSGNSQVARRCGSRSLGRPAFRGLYAFRDAKK